MVVCKNLKQSVKCIFHEKHDFQNLQPIINQTIMKNNIIFNFRDGSCGVDERPIRYSWYGVIGDRWVFMNENGDGGQVTVWENGAEGTLDTPTSPDDYTLKIESNHSFRICCRKFDTQNKPYVVVKRTDTVCTTQNPYQKCISLNRHSLTGRPFWTMHRYTHWLLLDRTTHAFITWIILEI
jgi:hypothetical protein